MAFLKAYIANKINEVYSGSDHGETLMATGHVCLDLLRCAQSGHVASWPGKGSTAGHLYLPSIIGSYWSVWLCLSLIIGGRLIWILLCP